MRRMPAEWERHERTFVAWPTRVEVWDPWMSEAEAEYAELVTHLAHADEAVVIVSRAEDQARVARRLAAVPNLEFLSHPIDDGWIRDSGPLAVCTDFAKLLAVDFDFNSWGERFAPWTGDRSVGDAIATAMRVDRESIAFVLEGGAISVNGAGSAIVVSECVLHPSRNGPCSRDLFERTVGPALGVSNFIWIPHGLLEDLPNTDGHVDNVAVFIADDTVLALTARPGSLNGARLSRNVHALKDHILPDGRPLRLVECPYLPYARMPDGRSQPSSYLNFAIANDAMIVPTVGQREMDSEFQRIIGESCIDRTIVYTPSTALTHGGGGPHCVTLQWPSTCH